MEYFLLGLLSLAIPIAWTAAFFLALGARKRLTLLEEKFAAFEGRTATRFVPAGPAHARQLLPSGEDPVDAFARGWQPPVPATPAPSVPPAQPTEAADVREPDLPAGNAQESGATPPTEPPAQPPPPPTSSPPPTGPGLEEQLGTRWVVWVGGVALALGGIFLVRYSIEQGLLGPGTRIVLGGLFAAGLIAAGEWLRRKETLSGVPGLPQASIPAILTAAGTTAAFATTWAAHGLYGFIGPAVAFVLLGIVALATLAAALLHGPALAGLGLVGAYATPLLVSSPEPSYWALYLYLSVVSGEAFALARIRLWRWLAITAVAASALWILPGLFVATHANAAPHAFYLAIVFALAGALIVSGFLFGPDAEPDEIDGVSSGALAAYLAAATLLVLASDHAPGALLVFTALVAATVAIAWRASSVTAALPVAALLAALVIAEWAVQIRLETLLAPGGPVARDLPTPGTAQIGMHLVLAAGFAALFGGAGFFAQGRYENPTIPMVWAGCALIAPVAILIALYYRIAGFEQSVPFAALALLTAALYATATEFLSKRAPRPGLASSAALFAVGTVVALALALTFALEKGWLTVALALMAPGIAMIAEKRPLPLLRWLAAACAVTVSFRILWEPRIVGIDVGTTPVFNWLLWGYGVPAVAFWIAGYLLRKRGDDVPARTLDSAAILFTVLTFSLQIRHYVNGGDIYRDGAPLMELGMHVSALAAIAIGLERVRGRTGSPVHDIGALVIAGLAFLFSVSGLLFAQNPVMTGEHVGGLFFNKLLLAYGLPAVLAITLALIAKGTRPMAYRAIAAASAVVLTLAYLSLQVRRFYQGPDLHVSQPTSDAEFWTYSAVWLAFGVALLLLGIMARSQPARLASALVIFLTVLKVFLLDLAGIGGIWRPLSFIGLGAVLIGIGWLYQRLLFPKRPPEAAAADTPPAPDAGAPSGTAAG